MNTTVEAGPQNKECKYEKKHLNISQVSSKISSGDTLNDQAIYNSLNKKRSTSRGK